MASKASGLHVGDTIKVKLKTFPELKNVATACHMIFPLVEKGKILETFDGRGAILHKNPRTAIGFNDRYFYMVVVDGRQKSLSTGMTAKELAEFMASIGCTEAANLDGGGSSTFWMSGERRNSVPGGIERTRGDALLIVQNPARKMAEKAIHEAGE
jgi:exopolysaccharide biosynthesis protein